MVRLKSRYVLFEVLFPRGVVVTTNTDEENTDETVKNPTLRDIILSKHKPCPPEISPKTILQEIRSSLQLNFGDYGHGKVGSLLQVKYFSNNTGTGIIRCHREDCDILVASLMFINRINDIDNVIVNPIKCSGTIKKIEQYSIRRSDKIMSILNTKKKGISLTARNMSNNTTNLLNDFSNVQEDRTDDI